MYVNYTWYCEDCKVRYEIVNGTGLDNCVEMLNSHHKNHKCSVINDYYEQCSGGYDESYDNGKYANELKKIKHYDVLWDITENSKKAKVTYKPYYSVKKNKTTWWERVDTVEDVIKLFKIEAKYKLTTIKDEFIVEKFNEILDMITEQNIKIMNDLINIDFAYHVNEEQIIGKYK